MNCICTKVTNGNLLGTLNNEGNPNLILSHPSRDKLMHSKPWQAHTSKVDIFVHIKPLHVHTFQAMTSARIQNHGRSVHAKPWHVLISQVVTNTCIPSHANALIILEFKIKFEEGSANVVILKQIVLITQLLQREFLSKPNSRGLGTHLWRRLFKTLL